MRTSPALLLRSRSRLTGPVQRGNGGHARAFLLGAAACLSFVSYVQPARAAGSDVLVFDAFDRGRDAPPNEEENYRSDGVYGRFDGQLSLVPSVGLQWAHAGWATQLGLSAYYLSTVGFTFRMNEGRWSPVEPRSDYNLSTLSLAVRPLFLLRWSKDWEKGPSFLDLTIDSLTLSVGAYWSIRHTDDTQHQGLETELSFGVPLLARAHGPWLTFDVAHRWPSVTHQGHDLDLAYGARFEWSFPLGD